MEYVYLLSIARKLSNCRFILTIKSGMVVLTSRHPLVGLSTMKLISFVKETKVWKKKKERVQFPFH